MRSIQTKSVLRRMARSLVAAAQGHRFAKAGKVQQSEQRKVISADSCTVGVREALRQEELPEVSPNQCFGDTSQRLDNRCIKPTTQLPDSEHNESKFRRWLNTGRKHDWVDSQLATVKTGMATPETGCTSGRVFGTVAAMEGHLEGGNSREWCEDEVIAETLDAVDLLVQRGCHVSSGLFYRLLRRCIQVKDLASGRRIHALSAKSGYEGDAFLVTQLIVLYASHFRLREAMEAFSKLPTPNAHNWATIISACARQGAAPEAIRLYRQMCESTNLKPDNRLYSAVLKACTVAKDAVAGKEVHAHILSSLKNPDKFVQAGLVNMYAKCGCLEDARRLFDKLLDRNVVTWTAMIAGYAQQGMGLEALSVYSSMQKEGVSPNTVTYVCLLQACASMGVGSLHEGKELHEQIKQRGLEEYPVVGSSLINMYAKCGSIEDARRLFDNIADRNIVTWTTMIGGYAQRGMGREALSLYSRMKEEGLTPNSVTYVCLLQACASVGVGALDEGRQLHARIGEQRLEEDAVVGGSLVNLYVKCGNLEDARKLFNKLGDRSVIAWTAMIAGYAQQGMGQEALSLCNSMQQHGLTPDSVTYVCLLQACANIGLGALHEGKQLHAQIGRRGLAEDAVLGGSLVNMYAKCGSLQDARDLFDKLPDKNLIAWNAMMAGYAQHGMAEETLKLYGGMRQEGLAPNSVTYVTLLQACACMGALHEGKQLHAQIEEQCLEEDVVLAGGLVNMYAKCGSLEDARRLFDKFPDMNVVAWNAMIIGYVHQGNGQEALRFYSNMLEAGLTPDSVTYVCLLQACASVGVGALDKGKQLHAQIEELGLKEDAVLGGSLVNMYAKCGSLNDAHRLFDNLPDRSVEAWNAMIAGYAQQGMGEEALSLFRLMQQEGLAPNSVTYTCLLQACAAVAALPVGEQLHAEIEKMGIQGDGLVGPALVNMYAKCGSICDAQGVFDSMCQRSIEAWNALVSGYARQGDSQIVFDLVHRMEKEGVHPDEITFLSVLTVCNHVGLVEKGREYFDIMRTEYGLSATMEHYMCMVDLLGRAGNLDEALQMIKNMPFSPNDVVWVTLLGACRKWKNVEIGQQAFNGVVRLDEKGASAYVLMANIYESTHMWEAAEEMETRRMRFGAWKQRGESWWTDMGGVVHRFFVGDNMHPESDGIYCSLEQLIPKLQGEEDLTYLESSCRI